MNKKLLLIAVLFIQLASASAQSYPEKSALLIIDMQEQFTKHLLDSIESGELISEINTAIRRARPMEVVFVQANMKVLSISFKGIKVQPAEFIELDSRLDKKDDDAVIFKDESSAFTVPGLMDYLEDNRIEHVYLAGIFLGECLSNTAIDGISRGYKVSILKECVRPKKVKKSEKLLKELIDQGAEVISLEESGLYY